jgi:hypothetical protein
MPGTIVNEHTIVYTETVASWDMTPCGLVNTIISAKHIVSMFRT